VINEQAGVRLFASWSSLFGPSLFGPILFGPPVHALVSIGGPNTPGHDAENRMPLPSCHATMPLTRNGHSSRSRASRHSRKSHRSVAKAGLGGI